VRPLDREPRREFPKFSNLSSWRLPYLGNGGIAHLDLCHDSQRTVRFSGICDGRFRRLVESPDVPSRRCSMVSRAWRETSIVRPEIRPMGSSGNAPVPDMRLPCRGQTRARGTQQLLELLPSALMRSQGAELRPVLTTARISVIFDRASMTRCGSESRSGTAGRFFAVGEE
jgi:hypothetical protein